MITFRVCEYDVWGNARDGYEINNIFRTDRTIRVREDKPRNLFNALKRAKLLKPGIRFSSVGFEYMGEWDYFLTDERRPRSFDFGHGEPAFLLERVK